MQVNLGATVIDSSGITPVRVGIVAILTDSLFAGLGDPFMELVIHEQDEGNLADFDQIRVLVTSTMRSRIIMGDDFDLDLLFDALLGTAVATLTVDADETATPALGLSRLNGLASPGAALISISALEHNMFPAFPEIELDADDFIEVDLVELRAAIPEPSTALLLASGLVALAVGRTRVRGLAGR